MIKCFLKKFYTFARKALFSISTIFVVALFFIWAFNGASWVTLAGVSGDTILHSTSTELVQFIRTTWCHSSYRYVHFLTNTTAQLYLEWTMSRYWNIQLFSCPTCNVSSLSPTPPPPPPPPPPNIWISIWTFFDTAIMQWNFTWWTN